MPNENSGPHVQKYAARYPKISHTTLSRHTSIKILTRQNDSNLSNIEI